MNTILAVCIICLVLLAIDPEPNHCMKTIALLAVSILTLSSCAFLRENRQTLVSLSELGLAASVASGKLQPGDAVVIGQGIAVVTDDSSTKAKVVKLAEIGLATAAQRGVIKPGDALLIREAGAILIKATEQPTPLPVTAASDLNPSLNPSS